MDILKGYLLPTYWRKIFLTSETAETFLSALGLFWLLTEISAFINSSWKPSLQSAWPYFAVASIAYTLWRRKPVLSVEERLDGTDIRIEIRIADIFTLQAAYVISTNTTFDTTISSSLISENSLQGSFTRRYYDKEEYLDADIETALKDEQRVSTRPSRVGGKSDQYAIGTVAKITPKNQTVYLLAIAQLNENGVAESSFEDVRNSLAALWTFISSRGNYEPLAIPILGTGHGRINTPRDVVIKEIIRSFIAACSERKFTNKLTIVISPNDYHDHELDIHEIGEFLKYACKYTMNGSQTQGAGNAVA